MAQKKTLASTGKIMACVGGTKKFEILEMNVPKLTKKYWWIQKMTNYINKNF